MCGFACANGKASFLLSPCIAGNVERGGMFKGFGHTATVPAPWDSGACLEMCQCHQLGEQWLPMVAQLSAEEI